MPTRSDLVDIAHRTAGFDAPIEAFRKALADFELIPVLVDGELSGVIAKRGNELHVSTLPEVKGRWFQKWVIRDVIAPILDKYGSVITSVRKTNIPGHEFVARIGFKQTSETEKEYIYVLSEIHRA